MDLGDSRAESKEENNPENSELCPESNFFGSSEEFTIFAYGIDPEVPQEKLKRIFSSFGNLIKLTPHSTNTIALIQYDNSDSFERALKETQYLKIGKTEILVLKKQELVHLKPGEGKLYLKGISQKTKLRDLHEHFGQISDKCLVHIFENDERQKRDKSGFIHFFNIQDALKALRSLHNQRLKGKILEMKDWDMKPPKKQKSTKGLYIENFPNLSAKDLEDQYLPILKSFGAIYSVLFTEKRSAVVNFKNPADTQDALQNLTKMEGCSDLLVGWVKSRDQVIEEGGKIKNRLYLAGLKFEVTQEILELRFGQFGQVKSSSLKFKKSREKDKFAVIAYNNEQDAEKAFQKAYKSEEIRELFISNDCIKIEYYGIKIKDYPLPFHPHPEHKPQPKPKPKVELQTEKIQNNSLNLPPYVGINQHSLLNFQQKMLPSTMPKKQPQPKVQQPAHFKQPQLHPLFQPMLKSILEFQTKHQSQTKTRNKNQLKHQPLSCFQMTPEFHFPQQTINNHLKIQNSQKSIQQISQLKQKKKPQSQGQGDLKNPIASWPHQKVQLTDGYIPSFFGETSETVVDKNSACLGKNGSESNDSRKRIVNFMKKP